MVAGGLGSSPEANRKRCRYARLALALTGLAMGLPGCQGRTDRAVAAGAGQGGAGRILYLTYCGSCHGGAGRGDGPAAGSLRTRPADLTRLFERYGSPLDRERVAEFVDGRALLAAHGSREMPIWGSEFFEDAPETTPNLEASKRRSIEVLVEYLETLQREQRT